MISKLCDCGELDRIECQCAYFEDPPWQVDELLFDEEDVEWGEVESTTESV